MKKFIIFIFLISLYNKSIAHGGNTDLLDCHFKMGLLYHCHSLAFLVVIIAVIIVILLFVNLFKKNNRNADNGISLKYN